MKTNLATVVSALLFTACFSGGGGSGSGGGSGTTGRKEYPTSVHITLNLNYSRVIKFNNGDVETETRTVGTFEGSSSSSTISGVNMVYAFENSIDGFSGASVFTKAHRGAGGGYDEKTETVTEVTGSNFRVTVGPTSFNLATGQLFPPFIGVVTDLSTGVSTTAGSTFLGFKADIPAQLDARCTQDTNVGANGGLALDGDVYTGYIIRQTYTCTADTTTFTYENSAQLTAL